MKHVRRVIITRGGIISHTGEVHQAFDAHGQHTKDREGHEQHVTPLQPREKSDVTNLSACGEQQKLLE